MIPSAEVVGEAEMGDGISGDGIPGIISLDKHPGDTHEGNTRTVLHPKLALGS